MSIIVFDLEWNMGMGSSSEPVLQEIVQVGAVKLESWAGGIVSEFRAFVRPAAHKKLHFRVKKMLPYDWATLKNGRAFPEVVDEFRAWCGENASFFSWGNSDIGVLRENLRYYSLPDKWLNSLYDLQATFGVVTGNLTHAVSLHDAVASLGLEEKEAFHDALFDAQYTAKVGMALLAVGDNREPIPLRESGCAQQLLGLDEPAAKALVTSALKESTPFFRQQCSAYPDRKSLLSSRSARLFRCPNCSGAILTSVWYRLGDVCMARTSCPNDGRIYTVLTMVQDAQDRWTGELRAYLRSETLQNAFLACKSFGKRPALDPLPGKKRKRGRWRGKKKKTA